jgi:hypothetical protein
MMPRDATRVTERIELVYSPPLSSCNALIDLPSMVLSKRFEQFEGSKDYPEASMVVDEGDVESM